MTIKEKGKLISIDGLGGSGKSTQINLLVNYLRSQGKDVFVQKFPDYDSATGKIIKQYLEGGFGKMEDISADFVSGLYALDRAAGFRRINALLENGTYVILDRSYYTGLAYQAAHEATYGDESAHDYMRRWADIEFNHVGVRVPHLRIYLATSTERALGLIDARGETNGEGRDIHEHDKEYMDLIIDNFDWLCVNEKVTKINVMDETTSELFSREDIHALIKEKVDRLI